MRKNKDYNKPLVLKLRDVRREKGMSLYDVANKTGLDYQKVSRVERGETKATVDTLYKLSKVLGAPISQLLGEDCSLKAEDKIIEGPVENDEIFLMSRVYNEIDRGCHKFKIKIENKDKVYIASIIFKSIQGIRRVLKEDGDLVAAFFQVFDTIFERLVLKNRRRDDV